MSTAWYCGLALLFSHGAAKRIFAKAKTGIEATMGMILIGMGGRLLSAAESRPFHERPSRKSMRSIV